MLAGAKAPAVNAPSLKACGGASTAATFRYTLPFYIKQGFIVHSRRFYRAAALLLASTVAAACGQKGPLILPEPADAAPAQNAPSAAVVAPAMHSEPATEK